MFLGKDIVEWIYNNCSDGILYFDYEDGVYIDFGSINSFIALNNFKLLEQDSILESSFLTSGNIDLNIVIDCIGYDKFCDFFEKSSLTFLGFCKGEDDLSCFLDIDPNKYIKTKTMREFVIDFLKYINKTTGKILDGINWDINSGYMTYLSILGRGDLAALFSEINNIHNNHSWKTIRDFLPKLGLEIKFKRNS